MVLPHAKTKCDGERRQRDDQARAQLLQMVDEAESIFVPNDARRYRHDYLSGPLSLVHFVGPSFGPARYESVYATGICSPAGRGALSPPIASLKPRMPSPSDRPISGSRFAPKTNRSRMSKNAIWIGLSSPTVRVSS